MQAESQKNLLRIMKFMRWNYKQLYKHHIRNLNLEADFCVFEIWIPERETIPSKHEALTQRCSDVGPPYTTHIIFPRQYRLQDKNPVFSEGPITPSYYI